MWANCGQQLQSRPAITRSSGCISETRCRISSGLLSGRFIRHRYPGPYAGFSEGGFEMEMKVTIIFASGPIIMAWGLGSA